MKKYLLPSVLILSFMLSGCTLPWQKITPKTETVPDNTETQTGTPATTAQANTPEQKDITPNDTPKAIADGGVYLPYTSTALAQAKGQIVLFFHANWCPTCIAANKDIEANLVNIPKNMTILKVNYDDATELRELYGVTAQHTFVQVDNTGKLLKKWRGSATLSEISGQVQQ